jgi:hypothetical protein
VLRSLTSVVVAAALTIAVGTVSATTLERLSLDEMIQKSHLIVRGKVLGGTAVQRGSMIYTVYRVEVTERLKGQCPAVVEVQVPGGTYGRLRQTFAGTPRLEAGTDRVLFIWTGKSGIHQIIGLSQGLFDIKLNQAGEATLIRGAIDAQMVDNEGKAVPPAPVSMTLRELRERLGRAGVALR